MHLIIFYKKDPASKFIPRTPQFKKRYLNCAWALLIGRSIARSLSRYAAIVGSARTRAQ